MIPSMNSIQMPSVSPSFFPTVYLPYISLQALGTFAFQYGGDSMGDVVGKNVFVIGDINDDGYKDMLIPCTNQEMVYVAFGGRGGMPADASFVHLSLLLHDQSYSLTHWIPSCCCCCCLS